MFSCVSIRGFNQSGAALSWNFRFGFQALRFEKNWRPVEFSKTEARLLRLLFTNKGRP
jgi:hypothetical protein